MIQTKGFATQDSSAKFGPFEFERRDVGPDDILIDILYAGICHSDIHQAKAEWEPLVPSIFPMVPGHEIVGRVSQVGSAVTKFQVGDLAGIGCFIDSCGKCPSCTAGTEQFCFKGPAMTYNGTEMDRETLTYGGYSNKYVIDQNYALKVRDGQKTEGIAPLLCAGITTYSPLKRWNVGPGMKVAVAGLGGLGHMGVKLAVAMGAEVTVISTSPSKEADARKLGATGFLNIKDADAVKAATAQFDVLLDTISAMHDYNQYLGMVKLGGVMVVVGVPSDPVPLNAFSLLAGNKIIAGSMIGGIPETQEMLDFCADDNVTADVEVISPEQIEEAYDRTIKSDVRYRFVIDMASV